MKGSKPLMSEMLDDTRRYLEQAEKTDVSELRDFLMTEPERPMIATGQGGSIPPAEYAALLYSSNCSIGKAMSRERVRQIRERGLDKMRKSNKSRFLLRHLG